MGKRIQLWKVKDNALKEVKAGKVALESDLHRWLIKDLSIISDDLILVGSEVRGIDILAMDKNGDLVIIELKRDKTPREVSAQAIEYASWVENLSKDDITEIILGQDYYEDEAEFANKFEGVFGDSMPEVVNTEHSIIIVGSELDDTTENIVNYLSEKYGVPINAALFEYFEFSNGEFLLARTMVIEEGIEKTRRKTKRAPNLTWSEVTELVNRIGVTELYERLVNEADDFTYKSTTRSTVSFNIATNEGRRTIFRVVLKPEVLSEGPGIRLEILKSRAEGYLKFTPDVLDLACKEEDGIYVYKLTGVNEVGELMGILRQLYNENEGSKL